METLSRQRAVVNELSAAAAGAGGGPVADCRAWAAVARQCHTFLRHLGPWAASAGFDPSLPDVEEHRRALQETGGRAAREEATFPAAVRDRAHAGLGLRLAVVGKGGAGKTFLTASVARFLARRGRRVLAVDLDTNPGLAYSLGLGPTDASLPTQAVEPRAGANYGWQLAAGLTPADAVRRYSLTGPEGVRVLTVGKIDTLDKGAAKRTVAAMVQLLLGFGAPDWDVLADLEAGPTTPFERYHAFADDVAVVVGPAWRSALTARRLLPMVGPRRAWIVANRFRDEPDHPGLASFARIPFDPCVAIAERRGRAPIDACLASPALSAVDDMTARLLAATSATTRRAAS